MKEHKLMVVDYNSVPNVKFYKCDTSNSNWKEEAANEWKEFFDTCVPCGVVDILKYKIMNL